MKKKITIKRATTRRPPDPITFIWLQDQFDQLHREHNIILKKINDIQTTILSPELEAAVNAVATQAIRIDRQVPDVTTKKKGR